MLIKIQTFFIKHLALFLVFLISVILWMLFYPAYMCADSIVQYTQALSGVYEDWHPPIMAIIVHYTLLLGGGIAFVTLIQTLFGTYGIYFLSKEILKQRNVTEKKLTWAPFWILFILILPVSPLPFYLMTFLKDTWICTGLIWISYLGLKASTLTTKTSKEYTFYYISLILLMAMMFITRYNAIVLIPVFFILLFFNSKRLSKPGEPVIPIILWSLLPVLLYIVTQKQLQTAFQIKKMHPENQVMAMESVGALVNNASTEKYVPYIKSNLTANYKDVFYAGNVASVMDWEGSEKTLNQQTFSIVDERIKKEYVDLALHAPFELAKVKSAGFYNMLKPSTGKYWYHTQLDPNSYGLVQNTVFKKARLGWQQLANNIHGIFLTSLIGAEHIVWLIITIALLIFLIRKRQMHSMLFIILLIPLGYYFSYLLACTGNDFRFMYPATLLVETISLSLLFSRKNAKQAQTASQPSE